MQLERENALAELEAYKGNQTLAERDFSDDDLRAVWKRMNGEPGDLLYAGEYRQ